MDFLEGLVAEWLRVGYCQGNLNSDNSALGGVTLDYGPFAFMERFNGLVGHSHFLSPFVRAYARKRT